MNKEDPFRDQAERLRKTIERNNFAEGKVVERTQMPPRSSIHKKKRKKNKWKLKYPIIRLLVLFFILLPITILSIYFAITKDKIGNSEKTTVDSGGFEIIDIEDSKQKETNP